MREKIFSTRKTFIFSRVSNHVFCPPVLIAIITPASRLHARCLYALYSCACCCCGFLALIVFVPEIPVVIVVGKIDDGILLPVRIHIPILLTQRYLRDG